MTSWQFVYLAAQMIALAALARIGAQAFELLVRSRRLADHRSARLLLCVFIAVAVVFLSKDLFWTVILFWRGHLPPGLASPLVLATILATIQIGASAAFTVLWEQLLDGD